jgi:hypothetical protein
MAIKKKETKTEAEKAGLTENTYVDRPEVDDGDEFCGIRESIDDIGRRLSGKLTVGMQRANVPQTNNLALWVLIRKSTEAINFDNYTKFMDRVLFGIDPGTKLDRRTRERNANEKELFNGLWKNRFLPFNDTDGYRLLKVLTEAFLMVNGGVETSGLDFGFSDADAQSLNQSLGGANYTAGDIEKWWDDYRGKTNGSINPILPYLALIRKKLGNDDRNDPFFQNDLPETDRQAVLGAISKKLSRPYMFELIWSYWQEEGMLVQTMNAIARRFQNIRSPGDMRDPLANLEIGMLFPLSNLLWGYVQDEQHRLSVVRRAYEYDHHYGISLQGKAVPKLRTADSRSKFIEAFHHLLYLSSIFFKQDDDMTVTADGFPLLNALREVHLVLSQGAHNQFGDLPSTARQEMLFQQWLLARPEFKEFLPTRSSVAYPEPWMDRVDAMKSLQGWSDTSITHFHNLAIFGEQILLSIRYEAWSTVTQPAQAANWARIWRAEIQGYTHAYRAATGVDLSAITSSQRVDSAPPSVHLLNRYRAPARGI